jgi:hypothetical protein
MLNIFSELKIQCQNMGDILKNFLRLFLKIKFTFVFLQQYYLEPFFKQSAD